MRLPSSVQEIANIIGTERALYLIGQLPKCRAGVPGKQSTRVIMYVPKTLKPDDRLVKILGWQDAAKLVNAFSGEIMQPANCADIYRDFRDRSIIRFSGEGMKPQAIADLLGVSGTHVRALLRKIPQQNKAVTTKKNMQ